MWYTNDETQREIKRFFAQHPGYTVADLADHMEASGKKVPSRRHTYRVVHRMVGAGMIPRVAVGFRTRIYGDFA